MAPEGFDWRWKKMPAASWSPVLECMTVQANPPTQYRLNVAQGFLVEARQNLAAGQWRACIDLCRTLPAYSLSTDPSFWSPELV